MRLSNRLNELLDVIPENTNTLLDIGCDHGKLIVSAVILRKCTLGIGVDISYPSLQKGIRLAEKYYVSDKVKFVESDGFAQIKGLSADVCVIAGMGGNEIVKILSQDHFVKTYIFSPHQDAHVLRAFMNANGLSAINDYIIKDGGKFYPIIVAEKGETKYTEAEIFLGKNVPEKDVYIEKNEKRIEYLSKIVSNIDSQSKLSDEILKEYEILTKWQKSRI